MEGVSVISKEKTPVLTALYELRRMLRSMEQDVGLDALSNAEWNILLAAHSEAEPLGEAVSSDQIRHHELTSDIAQATYHRALRSLLARGLIEKAEGYKAGRYVVRADLSAL